MNLVASDAEVEDKFTESKSPYTEEEFQKKLKDTGLTVDDLKSDIRRQLSIEKLLNREVVAKISITDQDVTDFYNKNRAQFNVAEPQYHIAQIVVTPSPGSFCAQSQERQSHHRSRSQAQSRRPRAEADRRRGFRAARHGLFRGFDRLHRRRSRLHSRIGAQSVRSCAEENRALDEAGRSHAARSQWNQGLSHPEVDCEGSGRTARACPIRKCNRPFATCCATARNNFFAPPT